MDWKKLLLTADGRIDQKLFWTGFGVVFVATLILQFIPVLGQLAALALVYPTVCIFVKRLHDMGKSGWLVVIPYAILGTVMLLGVVVGGLGITIGAAGGGGATVGALAGLGLMMVLMPLAGIACLAFLLWVGLSKGEGAPNRFGPVPALD